MPKPFFIGVEIEEVALGAVMRKLSAMPGIVALHMDFDKPRQQSKPNGRGPGHAPKAGVGTGRARFEESGPELVHKLLSGKKGLTHSELKKAFVAHGRSANSVNSVVWMMRESGDISRSKDGLYSLKKKRKKKAMPVEKRT